MPLLLQAVIDWIDKLPPGLISKTMAIMVLSFVANIITVYGFFSSQINQRSIEEWQEADAAHHEEVELLLEDLSQRLDAMAPGIEDAPLFCTTCPLPLRVAPNGKAPRVGTVPVGVLVEQMDQQGRWLSVVYLNLKSGLPVAEWIYRHGLVAEEVGEEESH